MKEQISMNTLISYVLAQLVGAALAVKFNAVLLKKSF